MANLVDEKNITELLDEDILEIMGGQDLSPEKKEELYLKMTQTIQNRAIARIYDRLSEEEANKLDQLMEADDNHQIEQFLNAKNIDLAKILLEEAIVYKTEMIELYRSKEESSQDDSHAQ